VEQLSAPKIFGQLLKLSYALGYIADALLFIKGLVRLCYAKPRVCQWSGYSQKDLMVLEGRVHAEH